MQFLEELKKNIRGEIIIDSKTLSDYSRDASLFEVFPKIVIFPKDNEDIKKIVQLINEFRRKEPSLSLTARSAGTDMTGGPLSESIVIDVTKHLNRTLEIGKDYAIVQPGVYFRVFEKEIARKGLMLPSYPASKEICAVGGMVANNSGGEKSLIYGKTEKYVESLKVILSDGEEYFLEKLSKIELQKKIRQQNFEGEIYQKLFQLLEKNYDLAKNAKPDVAKNSSGYNIWDIWDREFFNIVKLFVGSQGTLGIITQIRFKLVKIQPYSGMAVVFTKDLFHLSEIVESVLPLGPSSFESFDDHTLKLALKFFRGFLKLLGAKNFFSLLWQFLPDFWMILTFGMPKLVFLIEFEGSDKKEIEKKLKSLKEALGGFKLKIKIAKTKEQSRKYWAIRRESFNLLRQKIKDKQTAPFIDDLVVRPEKLPEFLPALYEILDRYQFLYTIAGHIGEGNFHIIPLMNLSEPQETEKISSAAEEVYDLVIQFGGSISGEHNDGLIRSPYIEKMFGAEVYKIFEQVKKIFDPKNIFNPGKKVGSSLEYALDHIKSKF